jgi:ABC-type sugar transport system ATPase subunit
VTLQSPRDALAQGVAFIPQELAYVPELTAAENIVLGQWPNQGGLTSAKAIRRRAEAEVARFGLDVDVRQRMSNLKLADRQLVEILKALARKARLILLDEPTASLTDAESQVLFRVLRNLCEQGVGVVYISHRMDEVFRFSDRVDVLRNGALVRSAPTATATPADLIAAMLGQAAEQYESTGTEGTGNPLISLENWTSDVAPQLQRLNITVRAGEMVGLFGIRGSGTDLVAEALAGRADHVDGRITILGQSRSIFQTPREAVRAGLAYVPAERKKDGLLLSFPIRQNLSLFLLNALSRFGFVQRAREESLANRLIAQFNVRCRDSRQPVEQLSGGNQQKVMLASRLVRDPKIVVLHEPTRGVDVGARLEIHRILRDVAGRGAAILLVTSDIEEAVAVSDRLLVMRDGALQGELLGTDKTQGQALRLATGTR